MRKLIEKKPKRLFAFGCSFTEYKWATWANILAYDFDCEFYNFGKSGAGNTYITNQITQANNYFKFNKDDLVIVSWTNISREDRWSSTKGWVTPGNIYSQQDYDQNFVRYWANDIHFALRDFSNIDLIRKYLESTTNYHFLSMCDITKQINQWEDISKQTNTQIESIIELYQDSLNCILPSFYDVLWNGDIDKKWQKDWKEIHPHYSDGHPTILEHYKYLNSVFDYDFSERTKKAVENLFSEWVDYIRQGYKNTRRSCGLHDMPTHWTDGIYDRFRLKIEEPIPAQLFH